MKDSLFDRMKSYEDSFRHYLPKRMPIIIRLDGCHFSSYTNGSNKPFDSNLNDVMNETAKELCGNIQGSKLAYVQSDEISILINSFENLNSESWYSNNIQKIVSVSAAIASTTFTNNSHKIFGKTKTALFDSRVFVLPKEDVNNYFIWRQKDCTRNSVQMLARSLYSQSECFKKNVIELKKMCIEANQPWEDIPNYFKFGRVIVKKYKDIEIINKKTNTKQMINKSFWDVENDIPEFTLDNEFINKFIK